MQKFELRNHRNNEKWWISEHKTNHFFGRERKGARKGGRTLLPLEAVIIINWSATLSWSGIWHLLASVVANWFGLKPKLIPALTVRSSLRFRFAWTVSLSLFFSSSSLHLWQKVNVSPLSNALVGIARRSFNEFQFQFQLQSEMYLALMPTAEWLEGGGGGGTGSEPSAVAFRGAINLLICFDAHSRLGVREEKRERVTGRVKQREVQ